VITKPGIAAAVHYVSHGTPVRADGSQAFTSCCRAALVTEVHKDGQQDIGLCVLNPTGIFFQERVSRDELPPFDRICRGERTEHLGGTWHWPRPECG
jgi:hypothetical protein